MSLPLNANANDNGTRRSAATATATANSASPNSGNLLSESINSEYSVSTEKNNSPLRIRQRTSKACDHCNSARRKCDGQQPCGYCSRTRSSCDYTRQAKKRGKAPGAASKKLVRTSPNQAQLSPESRLQDPFEGPLSVASRNLDPSFEHGGQLNQDFSSKPRGMMPDVAPGVLEDFTFSSLDILMDDYQMFNSNSSWSAPDFGDTPRHNGNAPQPFATEWFNAGASEASPPSGAILGLESPGQSSQKTSRVRETYGIHSFDSIEDKADSPILSQSLPTRTMHLHISKSGALPQAESRTNAYDRRNSNNLSPRAEDSVPRETGGGTGIRYPVLRDTISLLRPIIPDTLSFDLLEAYFKVSPMTNANLVPSAPPSIYRRNSFLRAENPRQSSRALLVSMLWLSAQTADIPLLNTSVARRKYVRRKLLEMTTKLLKPLNEVSLDSHRMFPQTDEFSKQGARQSETYMDDSLDEIMVYTHLAMVTSASEFKGASLRWWNLAFSLAREAKLNQEITPPSGAVSDAGVFPEYHGENNDAFALNMSEERKEERRRVWWFLYTADRYLSLSYNKPLSLLDSECQNLRRPCDELTWSGEQDLTPSESDKGPSFECSGPSFYGFFMPLAALLGEIVYFVGAQHHPRFGVSQNTLRDWRLWEQGISDRLDAYIISLQCLLQPGNPTMADSPSQGSASFQPTNAPHMHSADIPSDHASLGLQIPCQNRVAHAYATVVVNVLHVLLAGRWDALTLLDRANPWASSPDFVTTIGYVVEAAKGADTLLDLDPDAYFMPFFLGIFLFQGSLHLCIAADRLKTDAADIVIKACETMIRVHEAHIVRMPSEYQTLLVSALKLGLKEMKGRTLYVSEDPEARRSQVFRRYRWTGEAKGLAV